MTDETKATAPQSAENAPAITDPEQIKAEAERAAKEVAERKARSLDIMENYRDNQKAEKEERAKRAASANRARAKAAEEKRLKEEAERAELEEARRKENEEFEARAKRNAAMLTEIGEEEARQKEEEAAEMRLAAKNTVTDEKPIAQTTPEESARPAAPATQSTKAPAFAMPAVTDFFADSSADSDDLLSAVTVDGVSLGGNPDGVTVLGSADTADSLDDLASLIDIRIDLPESTAKAEPTAEETAAPAAEAPAKEAAAPTYPTYPTPDDYMKAWQAAYGIDAASYEEQMKKWWNTYGAMYRTPAPAAPKAAFVPVVKKPVADAETERAVENTVKETAAAVAEEEKEIAAASALDPLANYLKEQSEKIAERRNARSRTRLPDKLDVQAEICNLYFEALAEIYRQDGKKFRKLYRDGARREIEIYNDMLRKYLKKNAGVIAFIPVDPTIPNRILKGEDPAPLFVKPLQREDAASRKDKIFDDIEKMEGVTSPDDFAKWIAEQETLIREKKAAFRAAPLNKKLAIEEAVCRILFEVLHQIAVQNKQAYAAAYKDKAKQEISVYNDLVRKAGNPKKTGLSLLAYNIPDRLLKGEVFDPFAKNSLQKNTEEDAFTKYLAEKNTEIREAKSRFEIADAESRIAIEREVCSHYFDILEQIRIHKKKAFASTYKSRALAEIKLYNSLLRKAGKWYNGDRTEISKTIPDRILRGEMGNPFRRNGERDDALALLADVPASPEEQRHNDEAYLTAKEKYEISRRKKCYYTTGLSFLFRARKDQKSAKRRMKKEIRAIEKRVKPVEETEAYFNAKYIDLVTDTKPARRRRANPIMLRRLRERITDLLAERDRINRRLVELYGYDTWKPATLGKKGIHTYLKEKNNAFRKMKKTADRVNRMRLDPSDRNDLYRLMDRVTELQAEIRAEKLLRRKQTPEERLQAQLKEATLVAELAEAEDRLADRLRHAEADRRRRKKEAGANNAVSAMVIIASVTAICAALYLILHNAGVLPF